MTEFTIRRTEGGLHIALDPDGKHISGNAYVDYLGANAEVIGWASAKQVGPWRVNFVDEKELGTAA